MNFNPLFPLPGQSRLKMDTVEDDWYQVLKVRPDATQAEITAAHRVRKGV